MEPKQATPNRATKRNEIRFPKDYRFQLSSEQHDNLRCQIGTSSDDLRKFAAGGRRYMTYAYTKRSLAQGRGGPSLATAALGDIARAHGMIQLAKETGITRDGLYKALSPTGNPSFATVQKVVKALGYRLEAKPMSA